jgi:thiamine pyrophosphate-dependent acetolactate synthase large subunit-like protein
MKKKEVMNVQTKKLELVQLILNTNKPALLEKVSKLLKQEKEADWWDEIPETVKESIEIALDQADRGKTIPHKDVIEEARAKYKA